MTANGYVLYEGPSQLDGRPIVCIVTGFRAASDNVKTGDMLQTWILLRNIDPQEATLNGSDFSVCGDCALRGVVSHSASGQSINQRRACYVAV